MKELKAGMHVDVYQEGETYDAAGVDSPVLLRFGKLKGSRNNVTE